jgi:hypothetical protein
MDTTKKITELKQRANLLQGMIAHSESENKKSSIVGAERSAEWIGRVKEAVTPALAKAVEIRPDATIKVRPYYHNIDDAIFVDISVPDKRYHTRDILLTFRNSKPETSTINAGSSEEVMADAVVWYGLLSAIASAMPEIQTALSPFWAGWDFPETSGIDIRPIREELIKIERKLERLSAA